MLTIILEGENKTGKSTLAKLLHDKYGYEIVKCSQPEGDPYIEYMEKLNNISKPTVFDRFHLGESVYGPIYRGKSGLTDEQKRNIELLALAKNTIIIYCYDNEEAIAKRFEKEKEEFASKEKITKAQNLYRKEIGKTILPVYYHQIKTTQDLTKNNRLYKVIIEKRTITGSYYKNIIGNTINPKYLFVGDKRNSNGNKYEKVGQAFDFGPSSKFLFESLKKARIPLSTIALANSIDDQLMVFLACRQPDVKVVALGKNAAKVLDGLGVLYIKLNHPSYEQRFHSKDSKFVSQLRKI